MPLRSSMVGFTSYEITEIIDRKRKRETVHSGGQPGIEKEGFSNDHEVVAPHSSPLLGTGEGERRRMRLAEVALGHIG